MRDRRVALPVHPTREIVSGIGATVILAFDFVLTLFIRALVKGLEVHGNDHDHRPFLRGGIPLENPLGLNSGNADLIGPGLKRRCLDFSRPPLGSPVRAGCGNVRQLAHARFTCLAELRDCFVSVPT